MEFTVSIGLVGLAVLAVGALAIGATDLFLSQEATGIEATATAIGAFIGGLSPASSSSRGETGSRSSTAWPWGRRLSAPSSSA